MSWIKDAEYKNIFLVTPYFKGHGLWGMNIILYMNYTSNFHTNDIITIREHNTELIDWTNFITDKIEHIQEGDFFEEVTIITGRLLNNNLTKSININRQNINMGTKYSVYKYGNSR